MDNPVFIIGTLLSIAFTLKIDPTTYKCNKSFISTLERQFIHGSPFHLLSNTYVFYQLTTILGPMLGTQKYFGLTALLVALNGLADYGLYGNDLIGCSVGFSGVIFSLLTWVLLTKKGFTQQLAADLLILLAPSVADKQISFSGHLIGIIVGAIVYYISHFWGKIV